MGIMEQKMETTMKGLGFEGNIFSWVFLKVGSPHERVKL